MLWIKFAGNKATPLGEGVGGWSMLLVNFKNITSPESALILLKRSCVSCTYFPENYML